jgi:hypothetical protein
MAEIETQPEPHLAEATFGGWRYNLIHVLITAAGVFLAIEISKVI